MKRRRLLILIALVAGTALVVALWPRGPREPVYNGKGFMQWVGEARRHTPDERSPEYQAAFDAIGSNAVPFLLHEFTRPVSKWRERVNRLLGARSYVASRLRSEQDRIDLAASGFAVLGSNAAPALPVLDRYRGDRLRKDYVQWIYLQCGTAALPHLQSMLSSTNVADICYAVELLWRFNMETGPARALLAEKLKHPSEEVRAAAVRSWGTAMRSNVTVVRDLELIYNDPSPFVRGTVMHSLLLVSLDTTPEIAEMATNTLRKLQTNAPPAGPR